MIVIVDYGMGNLRSVEKAFHYLGFPAMVASVPDAILDADGVVLPGVGAFGEAMENLRAKRLDLALRAIIEHGKPFLGICLGLQLLFSESEEFGRVKGLGIFPGKVVRFSGPMFERQQPAEPSPEAARPAVRRGPAPAWDPLWEAPPEMLPKPAPAPKPMLKVPHMGWNSIKIRGQQPMLANVPEGAMVHFEHTYFPVPEDANLIAATCEYGIAFVCAIGRGRLFASQFHPEKSHKVGLQIMRNFAEMVYPSGASPGAFPGARDPGY